MKQNLFLAFLLLLALGSCNKDEEITQQIGQRPTIELDSQTGIYTVKTGHVLTIVPVVQHAENATFAWSLNGQVVGHEVAYTATWPTAGVYYLTFTVQTPGGQAEEELRVEVAQLTPPVISLVIPSEGLKVVAGVDYILTPTIQHADLEPFAIEWLRGDAVVSHQKSYTFHESQLGTYPLTIRASNGDGQTSRTLSVEVVERMPASVIFPTPSYFQSTTDRYTLMGRTLYLTPRLSYFNRPQFAWQVDGAVVADATAATLRFAPDRAGTYVIAVTVRDGASKARRLTRDILQAATTVRAEVTVHCVAEREEELLRAKSGSSIAAQNKVYEWTPAPGQFIGEVAELGGVAGNEALREVALQWATQRLAARRYVSLGAFGGYLIVGFDHSIRRTEADADFTIAGNAFGNSSEPGIVSVMQDTNRNGLPDDEWYELKGCETAFPETIRGYEITYFRPAGRGMPVPWSDSEGKSGQVDYLPEQHAQDSYYPAWIVSDSYTLRGTCLSSKNKLNPLTGLWEDKPFDWGYADNYGNDCVAGGSAVDGSGQRNGFRIANATQPDGTPIVLQFIDFVRVQTGVNANRGPLGEVSTEVFGFGDYSMR